MHKKLEADLTSLAHSILQMKNKDDVFALQKKAHEVYEKLSVLAYIEEYINNTPNPEHTKEELIALVEEAETKKAEVVADVEEEVESPIEEIIEEEVSEEQPEEIIKHNLEDLTEEPKEEEEQIEEVVAEESASEESEEEVQEEIVKFDLEEKAEETVEEEPMVLELIEEPEVEKEVEVEQKAEEKKAPSLDDELKDTIAVDVVADLFENATKKSLNDTLQGDIQIGLNDRIAFVKNLFSGSQEDFNRVISQLNTFKTEKEARKFINKMVKPDYNWSEKEEYEERFMSIIERKFT